MGSLGSRVRSHLSTDPRADSSTQACCPWVEGAEHGWLLRSGSLHCCICLQVADVSLHCGAELLP